MNEIKEDVAMLFGNDSWMTGKEMDSPSGWQFAARGAWMCACSKSGCCQEWLSPPAQGRGNIPRRCFAAASLPTTFTTLCLWAAEPASLESSNKKKKKFFFRRLGKRSSLPPGARLLFFNISSGFVCRQYRYRLYHRCHVSKISLSFAIHR